MVVRGRSRRPRVRSIITSEGELIEEAEEEEGEDDKI